MSYVIMNDRKKVYHLESGKFCEVDAFFIFNLFLRDTIVQLICIG